MAPTMKSCSSNRYEAKISDRSRTQNVKPANEITEFGSMWLYFSEIGKHLRESHFEFNQERNNNVMIIMN